MPLKLKFSNQMEALAARLAAAQATTIDPFQPEVIVVAGSGIRRWLSLRIAGERGIAANVEFPTPQTFVQQLLRDALGESESPRYGKSALIWRIFTILKACPQDAALKVPLDYLDAKPDLAVMQLALRVADLFDQYLTYRPDWILAWDAGRSGFAATGRARAHEEWQRRLWTLISADDKAHRAALYGALIQRLQTGPVDGMAPTISVFGTHTLPPVFLRVLEALGTHHEVIIYLPQPTPEFWGDHPLKVLSSRKQHFQTQTTPDGEPTEWENPLIASWGGQGRDLFNLLIDHNIASNEADDLELFEQPASGSVLGALQGAIYRLEPMLAPGSLDPDRDDSVRVHCCHHPLREVEVLHDQLLSCFAADPSLRPNDILVLAPNIDEYAPFIEAVFDSKEEGVPKIPYAVTDRSLRASSRAVETFFQILTICRSRFLVTEIFALFQSPAFRARFGWDDDALTRIRTWLDGTRTAWGRDARHRAGFDLPALADHTWQAGFERIFAGYAMGKADAHSSNATRYYDELEGRDSFLIGQLAEAYDLLRTASEVLAGEKPCDTWADVLERHVVAAFLDANSEAASEVRQIRFGLQNLREATEQLSARIDLQALQVFLDTAIEDGSPARGLLSRGVSFGSLTPMRAIPHKVVCLIGMNHGAFPRDPRSPGFDLMQADELRRTGDRSAIQSGRYLFLETVLSAKQKLLISYCGFSPRNDSVLPPAIPVDELLAFLETTWPRDKDATSGTVIGSRFIVEHRLHGHHPAYFGADPQGRHFSYSKSNYAAAMAARKAAAAHAPFETPDPPEHQQVTVPAAQPEPDWLPTADDGSTEPIATTAPIQITVNSLIEFFRNPAKAYCKHHGFSIPGKEEELLADEPLEFNNLEQYLVRDHEFRQLTNGNAGWLTIERPYGEFGKWLEDNLREETGNAWQQLLADYPSLQNPQSVVEINFHHRNVYVTGCIDAVYPDGQTLRQIRFRPGSEVKPKDLIAGWIRHLFLCERAAITQTVLIARNGKAATIGMLSPEDATDLLNRLIGIYLAGLAAPLPFVLECSYAHAKAQGVIAPSDPTTSDRALAAAIRAWSPNDNSGSTTPGEDPWTLLCWGDQPPFLPPRSDEFGAIAGAVFDRLIQHL